MTTLLTSAPALTVADLCDENETFETMVEAARPYGCRSIEFVDESYGALKFRASVVAGHSFDEDGFSPNYEPHLITIQVTPSMPLHTVVFLLIGDITELIES